MTQHDAVSTNVARRSTGFTLIELLVVVAIISLLIGLLVPAVGRARSVAQSVGCLANLRSIGQAMTVYTTDERGFIPGPQTSGLTLQAAAAARGGSRWIEAAERADIDWRASVNESSSIPGSQFDWLSPVLGSEFGLPRNWVERLVQLLDGDFRCPANDVTNSGIYANGAVQPTFETTIGGDTIVIEGTDVRYGSYAAPVQMHVFYDEDHMQQKTKLFAADKQGNVTDWRGRYLNTSSFDRPVSWENTGYNFTVWTLGGLSYKAMAYDGTRYIDQDGNVNPNFEQRADGIAYGEAFMSRSPVVNIGFDGNGNPHRYVDDSFEINRDAGVINGGRLGGNGAVERVTFRHPGNTINQVFFDGHAENMDDKQIRRAQFYFPSGSEVISDGGSSGNFGDPTLRTGDIVP
ncbi:MAG: prepilin-type N-terminal cleavage/methylation domain-containing protein [Planctomycetota bacterium]